MSLKPIAPKHPRPKRVVRPVGAPVVVVQKKNSGSGGLIMGIILAAALGAGYYVYNNQQQHEAALAAKQQRLEANEAAKAENERLRQEHENEKKRKKDGRTTALGTASAPAPAPAPSTPSPAASPDEELPVDDEAATPQGRASALGSTVAPGGGTGLFNAEDTSAPVFDLKASGKAEKKVMESLDSAIDKAAASNTFHDLLTDLKRSFEVAQPGFFADATTLPDFPDKEQKLLRYAQGVYICLTIAAELDAEGSVPDKEHAKFVKWLMKEKGKPARTFTYGLEHYSITDMAKATKLLGELRTAYLTSPTSAEKKIKPILEKGAKN